MDLNSLNELFNFIQTAPDRDKLTATVLKLAADSAALKTVKNTPAQGGKSKNYLKFTKQEVENMPEKIYITVTQLPTDTITELMKQDTAGTVIP